MKKTYSPLLTYFLSDDFEVIHMNQGDCSRWKKGEMFLYRSADKKNELPARFISCIDGSLIGLSVVKKHERITKSKMMLSPLEWRKLQTIKKGK